MKHILYIIFLPLLFASCATIYFFDPQPKSGLLLNEFPVQLQGKWQDKEGKVVITSNCYQYFSLKSDSAEKKTDKVDDDNMCLSDTVRLYKAGDYILVNLFHQNISKWEIICVIKKEKNDDLSFFYISDPEVLTKDKNLKLTNANFTIDGVDTMVTTLQPPHQKQAELNSATFSGQMGKKTIRRITKKKNLVQTLKKNGLIVRKMLDIP